MYNVSCDQSGFDISTRLEVEHIFNQQHLAIAFLNWLFLYLVFFKLALLTQFPALNDKKYLFLIV